MEHGCSIKHGCSNELGLKHDAACISAGMPPLLCGPFTGLSSAQMVLGTACPSSFLKGQWICCHTLVTLGHTCGAHTIGALSNLSPLCCTPNWGPVFACCVQLGIGLLDVARLAGGGYGLCLTAGIGLICRLGLLT